MIRRLLQTLSLFGLATVLSTIVWITAVNEENPIIEQIYPQQITIKMNLQSTNMKIEQYSASEATVVIRAPSQIWSQLNANQINIVADLNELSPGTHTIPLEVNINTPDAEILSIDPEEISINLTRMITKTIPIVVNLQGEPAVGYVANSPIISTENIIATGSEESMSNLNVIDINLNINQSKDTINRTFTFNQISNLQPILNNITLQPTSTMITVPIQQLGGYRDVAVRALLDGKPEVGYRITNITTSPPTITLFSNDPDLLASLPGFIETEPLDISDALQDIDARLTMALPEEVTAVSEQSINVLVSIEAVQTSQRIRQNVTIVGLGADLSAQISPESVDVIMSGPLPILDSLTTENVNVVLDLIQLKPGNYEIEPSVIVSGPDIIKIDTILPSFISVKINNLNELLDEESNNNNSSNSVTNTTTTNP
tara:strand:- start:907 stop:2196 length:1290 start_codon:yes stop_codon:yes gene_type:complete